MALYLAQHIYHSTTALPEDDVVNTMHFADDLANATPTRALAIAGRVAAAFFDAASTAGGGQTMESFLAPQISRVLLPTIKVYDGDNGGSPIAIATQAGVRASSNASSLPAEVAAKVTYHADLTGVLEEAPDGGDPGVALDRPRQRRRNGMYIGPFNTNALTGADKARVDLNLRSAMCDLILRLKAVFAAPNDPLALVVYSAQDPAIREPVSVFVDDAFDTIRKRGLAPTVRTTLALP